MCPSRHKNGSNVGIPVVSFGMSLDASALSELQDSPELRHGTFTERTEWCCGCIVAHPEIGSSGPQWCSVSPTGASLALFVRSNPDVRDNFPADVAS